MNSEHQEQLTLGDEVKKVETEGIQRLKVSMLKLYRIWNEFGLEDDQKHQRAITVWKHIENLIQEISEEESSFCEDVKERIRNYTKKIEELSSNLQVAPVEVQGSLIKKEEMLRQELDSLTKLKNKRYKAYQDLKNIELKYCQILKFSEHVSSNTGVPTENDILELQQHIDMLKEERDKRYARFCRLKTELTTILEETALEPETSHEREIVYSRESISLGNETFKTLEEMISRSQKLKEELETRKKALLTKLFLLWERLKIDEIEKAKFLSNHTDCKVTTLKSIEKELERCEQMKKENLKTFIDAVKVELEDLWIKSCISDSQKPQLRSYSSSDLTDEVLEEYEAEAEKWKSYLNSVSHILNKINKRQQLFDLLLNFDQKARDPNRFKNRKGNLLKEEKERNKLQKDLPALETEIFHDIEEYEVENGAPFLYFGEDFRVLITRQWSERIRQKENVKLERHKQHLLQLQTDVTVGTPSKRSSLSTPKTAPSKLFKSGAGAPQFRTPAPQISKNTPKTVGRLALKCGRLFSSQKKDPKRVLRERNPLVQTSQNTTTYTDFAEELNSTKRYKLRSSVLATRKPGGTRISQGSKRKSRKSGNTSKLTSKFTPARGKYGLPFLI